MTKIHLLLLTSIMVVPIALEDAHYPAEGRLNQGLDALKYYTERKLTH